MRQKGKGRKRARPKERAEEEKRELWSSGALGGFSSMSLKRPGSQVGSINLFLVAPKQ